MLTKVELVEQPTSRTDQRSPNRGVPGSHSESSRQQSSSGRVTELLPDYRTWKYCSYCGSPVSLSDWRFCANCGASLSNQVGESTVITNQTRGSEESYTGNCMVCGLIIHHSESAAYCPHCGNAAHKPHLQEWLHIKGQCPICGERLAEHELQ